MLDILLHVIIVVLPSVLSIYASPMFLFWLYFLTVSLLALRMFGTVICLSMLQLIDNSNVYRSSP